MDSKKSEYLSGERLEPGLMYQDFITDELYKRGFPINCYSSRKWNIEKGESVAHLEIKFDNRMSETGNIYIETEERHNTDTKFGDSGIFRDDNTLFYLIGNYKEAYIFMKKQLKSVCKSNNFKTTETPTSKGILIPIKYLKEHSLLYLHVEFKNNKECQLWQEHQDLIKENLKS